MAVVDVLAWIGAGLTLVSGAPQIWRTLRSSVAGVSGATWAFLSGSSVLWALWAIPAGVPLVAWSEGVFGAAAGVIAWRCWGWWRSLAVALMAAAGCVSLGLAWGEWGFGVAGIAASVVGRVPQIWRAWTSGDVSGVSSYSWWCLTLSNVAWTVVGVMTREPVLYVGAAVVVASSLVIIVGVAWPRPRMNVVAVPVEL